MIISPEEYRRRFDRVAEMMKEKELRAVLIYSPHREYRPGYLRWLTGWWTKEEESAILLITDSIEPVIFMNGTSYRTGDIYRAKDTSYIKNIHPTCSYATDVSTYLKKVGITHGKIGVAEWKVFPAEVYIRLTEHLPGVKWIDSSEYMNDLTIIKSAAEIELMRRAAAISDLSVKAAIDALKVGMTEHEFLAIAEFHARQLGAEISFISDVGSGVYRTWMGEPIATDRKMELGDLVMIDFGARWQGYHGDITRTVVMGGTPGKKQIEILNIVNETLLNGIDAIRSGVMASSLANACFQVVKKSGYEQYWNPAFIPHGIGVYLHEEPMLEPGYKDRRLECGMCINLEPGLYIPEIGGVRLENTSLVTEKGAEVLNSYPTILW